MLGGLGVKRNDVIAAGGEFIGTITFLLLGLGGIQVNPVPLPSNHIVRG